MPSCLREGEPRATFSTGTQMSWQGEPSHSQNGGAHENTHGNEDVADEVIVSHELNASAIEQLSDFEQVIESQPPIQDGDSERHGLAKQTAGIRLSGPLDKFDPSDLDVQKMDEWLKNRSDSLSSIDFEKETEVYDRHHEAISVITADLISFAPTSEDNGERLLKTESSHLEEKCAPHEGSTIKECDKLLLTGTNNLQLVSCPKTLQLNFSDQDLSSEDRACLEEIERGSQLTAEEKELLENSKKELNELEFIETDKDNTLMTPQELESMPERGIEFEQSVGPKDAKSSEMCVSEDVQVLQEHLEPSVFTNEPNRAVATISITSDKTSNITRIVINTSQGQQTFKINTPNLLASTGYESVTVNGLLPQQILMQSGASAGSQIEKKPDSKPKDISDETKGSSVLIPINQLNFQDNEVNKNQVLNENEDLENSGTKTGKTWTCPQPGCDRVYDKKCKLKVHIMTHSGVRPFQCEFEGCDWAFTTAYKLKRHMETHEGKKDYMCTINGCNKKFTTIYNLNAHKKLHTRPDKVTCPVKSCLMCFPTRHKMELHLREHEDIEAPYKCPSCGKEYYTANAISTHVKVHEKAELRCTFEGCGKLYDKVCRLRQHMRQHTGERPYVCEVEGCGWAFVTASKLTRHMRKHTGERRYICPEPSCGKSFLRAEHLQGHLVVHSRSRPFECPHENCNARFTAKSSLYVHMKKHNGTAEKVIYPCPVDPCVKKYNCKSSLRMHMLKFHTSVITENSNQLDYVTLLSNEELQELPNIEGITQEISGAASVSVSVPSITISPLHSNTTTFREATLVRSSEFITSAPFQPEILPQQVGDGIVTQLVMNSDIGTTNASNFQLGSEMEAVSLVTEPDLESIVSSRVLQENNSGSARTDYCSNHVFVDRARKRKLLQQVKLNLDSLETVNKTAIESDSILIDKMAASVALPQNDVVLTTTAITFHDPTTGTHFVQTPLLQDDPPTKGDLYQDENLLVSISGTTSLSGELSVPGSLLAETSNIEVSVSDTPQAGSTDFPTAASAVTEFTETTINLRDLE